MASLSIDITLARRDFDIDVAFDVSGALALVGPSGGGKTSILRSVAGLERPGRGRIALDDAVWFSAASIDRRPDTRSVGFVFQEYALFPHMSVRANVAFGAREPVGSVMERVGIAHLANALPDELSGGERQRVAVARALAREPQVLLLDEPTASLDALTREQVRVELAALIAEAAIPTIIVTHDFVEAATLGDRVGVLVDGRLRQLDAAATVLASPVDDFVARLTGSNVLAGIASPTGGGLTSVRLEDGTEVVSADKHAGPVAVAVLPRHVRLGDDPGDVTRNRVRGRVRSVIAVAGGVRVRIDQMMADLDTADAAAQRVAVGDVVTMTFAVTATRLVPVTAGDGTERYEQAGVRPTCP